MSLEEEIVLNQFGQGVCSIAVVMTAFRQLTQEQQRSQFIELYSQIWSSSLDEPAIERALTDCAIHDIDAVYMYLRLRGLTAHPRRVVYIPTEEDTPGGRLDNVYEVLLHLFKMDYQQRYALKKGDPLQWWYWDLSSNEVTRGIVTRHAELIEEIYANPSFRSEFIRLANHWHTHSFQEENSDTEPQTQFNFLTYDELLTKSSGALFFEAAHGMALLRQSVVNALAIQYKVSIEQASILMHDVIERYWQEGHHTGLV